MTEAEQLARKKRLRAGHRASTTRILGQVEPAIAADRLDVSKINQLKRSLEDKLQTDPPTTDPPAVDLPATDPSATDPPAADPPAADPPATDPPDPAISGTTRGAKVKLPKISLPRFNGNPVKWTSFWDSYQSAIHLNPDLSDVDKFSYLRSLLDSTAYDAIAGLTLSSANYLQAIEVLSKRFGNKQVIISNHMDTLMNMDAVSSDRHLRDLRRLYDKTESHVCSLKSLGIEATSYGALLSPVLLAKLPP